MPNALFLGLLDPHLAWAMGVVALAGVVRGASGFGQALVFVPLAGSLYRPAVAIPMLWVLDACATPLLVRPHLRTTDWPEVLCLACGGAVTLPIGVWLLAWTDPLVMRWIICTLVLLTTLALAGGWRLALPETRRVSLLLGGASGLAGGATGMSGPPLVLSWLGRRAAAARIRSNIFIYVWLLGYVSLAVAVAEGVLNQHVLIDGLVLLPCYAITTLIGHRGFQLANRLAPERTDVLFRRLALCLCAASACAGLPLWQ